jgi:hypothetical protein
MSRFGRVIRLDFRPVWLEFLSPREEGIARCRNLEDG